MVHRLLEKALKFGNQAHLHVKKFKSELLEMCNEKRMAAKKVSDGCNKVISR